MKLEHSLIPYTKINSKQIKDLDIRPNNVKLKRKTQAEHSWAKIAAIFFGFSSQSNGNKNKNKWDLIKIKSFCTAKEVINKMKRQSTEWEKIFANDEIHKGANSSYSSTFS